MDTQALIAQAGLWFFIFIFGLVALEFTLIHLMAKAARMKNRSYNSFFWLGLVLTPIVLWVIVASLPFNQYDKRSPFTDTQATEPLGDRYVNYWSKEKLVTTGNKAWLWISSLLMVFSLLGSFFTIAAYSSSSNAQSGSDTNFQQARMI